MKILAFFLASLILLGLAVVAFIYSGFYPMGADTPHYPLTYKVLETVRERSIGRASRDITVPDLNDPTLLLTGGPDYDQMCSVCHLAPGRAESDLSIGLYPKPPNLSLGGDEHRHVHAATTGTSAAAQRQFWIIKHGIKASGMPAWGPTHDDQRIWAMVAFLQQLPRLSPQQYQILTSSKASEQHH